MTFPVVWTTAGKEYWSHSWVSPTDVLGVAEKETDYIAFEYQTFDASGVGFYEVVMIDHLKQKKY